MNFSFVLDWFQGIRKLSMLVQKRFSKYLALGLAVLIATSASFVIFNTRAVAIDAIKIKYGAADISVTVSELATFASTGQVSDQLRSLFQIAKADPEQIATVRDVLGRQLTVNPNFLNELLSSYYGKLALSEVSKYITPGSNTARTVDDLRTTINSVLQDGRISLIEVLQRYQGTNAIVIDGEKVVSLVTQAVQEGRKVLTFLQNEPEVQRILCKQSA